MSSPPSQSQLPPGPSSRSHHTPPPTPQDHLNKDRWVSVENGSGFSPNLEIKPLGDLKEVEGVPTLIGGEQLPYTTRTADFFEEGWNMNKMKSSRLVAQKLTEPIETFGTYEELMRIINDAYLAHEEAYEKGYLHRDISPGNIVKYRDPKDGKVRGLLIDSEKAKKYRKSGSSQPWVSGTWEFMSILSCQNLKKEHELQDDLESFVHVVIYLCIRICRSQSLLTEDLSKIFNEVYGPNIKGSISEKLLMITYEGYLFGGGRPERELRLSCQPLADWISSSIADCAEWVDGHMKPKYAPATYALADHSRFKQYWDEFFEKTGIKWREAGVDVVSTVCVKTPFSYVF